MSTYFTFNVMVILAFLLIITSNSRHIFKGLKLKLFFHIKKHEKRKSKTQKKRDKPDIRYIYAIIYWCIISSSFLLYRVCINTANFFLHILHTKPNRHIKNVGLSKLRSSILLPTNGSPTSYYYHHTTVTFIVQLHHHDGYTIIISFPPCTLHTFFHHKKHHPLSFSYIMQLFLFSFHTNTVSANTPSFSSTFSYSHHTYFHHLHHTLCSVYIFEWYKNFLYIVFPSIGPTIHSVRVEY